MSAVSDVETGTCRHCRRSIILEGATNPPSSAGAWVDPEATGDDSVWRETCDQNDTDRYAEHEPLSEKAEQYQAIVDAVDAYVTDGTLSVTLPNGFVVVRDGTEEYRRAMDEWTRLDRERHRLSNMAASIVRTSIEVQNMLELSKADGRPIT